MYQSLANYYDSLVKDSKATQLWVDFVKQHGIGAKVLEVACGSGEITYQLAMNGYSVIATDLSEAMIQLAEKKFPSAGIKFNIMDMLQINISEKVDTVCCFCDSINYLNDLSEVNQFIQQANKVLNKNGRLLFDMHSIDRIEEFSEPFIEEGYLINATPYQWTVESNENKLYHHFAFWEDSFIEEYHVQTVFDLNAVIELLNKNQFEVEVYTDFVKVGITAGERYCIVARKGE